MANLPTTRFVAAFSAVPVRGAQGASLSTAPPELLPSLGGFQLRRRFNPARRQPPAPSPLRRSRLMSCGSSNEGLLCRGEVGAARRFNHRETSSP